jgi:hypothetical protein
MALWKKILIGLLVAVVLPIAYWLISPLFIERRVSEKLEEIVPTEMEMQSIEEQAIGMFEGLAGHNATGTARLLKIGDTYYIRFDDDFRVTNGPDLFVHFGKDGEYDPAARIDSLKGNVGAQNYAIPENISVDDYNEVWVWCRSFAVPFGKAILK